MSDKRGPSGLTEREAAEYHGQFVLWTMIWAAGAAAAHFSAWMWRPWIHSLSQIDGANSVLASIAPFGS